MFASLTRFPRPLPGERRECLECLLHFSSSRPLPVFVDSLGGSKAFNSLLFEEQTATLMAVMAVMAGIGLNDPLVAAPGLIVENVSAERNTQTDITVPAIRMI